MALVVTISHVWCFVLGVGTEGLSPVVTVCHSVDSVPKVSHQMMMDLCVGTLGGFEI